MAETPGAGGDYDPEVTRRDSPQILIGPREQARYEGIILLTDPALYLAGTVLGRVTATGKYIRYLNGAVDGSELAVGVLTEEVDAIAADQAARLLVAGDVDKDKLVGIDAPGEVDMNAKTVVNAQGATILRIP